MLMKFILYRQLVDKNMIIKKSMKILDRTKFDNEEYLKDLPSMCTDIEVVKITNGYLIQFGKMGSMTNYGARNQWCYIKEAKNIPIIINIVYEACLKCIENNVPINYDFQGTIRDKIRKLKQ